MSVKIRKEESEASSSKYSRLGILSQRSKKPAGSITPRLTKFCAGRKNEWLTGTGKIAIQMPDDLEDLESCHGLIDIRSLERKPIKFLYVDKASGEGS